MHTFFTIHVSNGQSPKQWAARVWDTYGFDYDLERCTDTTICAWALDAIGDPDEALAANLEYDNIKFETFEVENLELFFGSNI